jgi:GTP cyclohydrolase I
MQQQSTTTTSALRGAFKKKAKVRAEFLSLARKS